MLDSISSVLPPALRPKLINAPQTPPTQFQVISSVSEMGLATQRMSSLLSNISSPQEEKKPPVASEDDLPEVEVPRGKAVNVTT